MSDERLSTRYRAENVCVVIPTLNEAATLAQVIEGARPFCAHIIVIDGGSTDGTLEIAQHAGVRCETLLVRGKGRALRHALALVQTPITIFIDADGSHDPRDIPRLVEPVAQGQAALSVGSRWTGGSDELHGDMNKWLRRSGSRVLTTLINLRWGARLSDIQNGFRAFDTRIGQRIGLCENDFTIEQEMIMKFLAGGFRVVNVPSHEYARQGGQAKLNLRQVWFRFGMVVLRHVFGVSRPRVRARRRH
jgi:glycosyltransferase involved in cell wall biosynthesis